MRGRSNADREFVLVAIIAVAGCVLTLLAWVPANWQEALHHVNSEFGVPIDGIGPLFSRWSLGDGQAFAVIASDPLGGGIGSMLGDPAYRYSRSGFGWLAWLFTLGHPRFVPYAFVVIGAASVIGLLVLARRLRPVIGPSIWLLVVNPAVYLAFAGGTAEALGVFLLALALATGNWWWSVGLAAVRPTFLLATVRHRRLFVPGVATALVVTIFVSLRFGFLLGEYGGRIVFPFEGYFSTSTLGSWSVLGASLLTAVVGVRRRNLTWVLGGILLLLLSGEVVGNFRNAWRAAGFLPVLWAFGADYRAPTPERAGVEAVGLHRVLGSARTVRTKVGAKAHAALFRKSQNQVADMSASDRLRGDRPAHP